MATNNPVNREFLARLILEGLLDSGVDDPDLRLFQGVFDNDLEAVKAAIRDGADVNVTDMALIRRHSEKLMRPPVSRNLVLRVITALLSASSDSRHGPDLAHAS